jgi:hypothetical protein
MLHHDAWSDDSGLLFSCGASVNDAHGFEVETQYDIDDSI